MTDGKREIRFSVADIVFQIREGSLPADFNAFRLPENMVAFEGGQDPLATYTVYWSELPKLALSDRVFESGGTWCLYRDNDQPIITIASPAIGKAPFKMAVLSQDFENGDIFIDKNLRAADQLGYPLDYPLDELLLINLLCRGRGIEVHACGLIDRGEGILFIGVSGAGKSTMANLWKTHTEAILLSDDRIVIRKRQGSFWIYGTPWHGDAKIAQQDSAPLKRIFFIVHARQNNVEPLHGVDALGRLISCCFPTFWDKTGMDFVLDLAGELCSQIDFHQLGFTPDNSAIDFVRALDCQKA